MYSVFLSFATPILVVLLMVVFARLMTSVLNRMLKRKFGKLRSKSSDLRDREKLLSDVISENFSGVTSDDIREEQVSIEKARTSLFVSESVYRVIFFANKVLKWFLNLFVGSAVQVILVALVISISISAGFNVIQVMMPDIVLPPSEYVAGGGGGNYNAGDAFFGIDWSQDFSSTLQKFEDEFGYAGRSWAEFTVMNMYTNQMNFAGGTDDTTPVPGLLNGVKSIESSQYFKDKNGLVNKPLDKHYFYYGTIYSGRDSGLMQLDTKWERLNPYYDYNLSDRQPNGLAVYLPDAVHGLQLGYAGRSKNEGGTTRERAHIVKAFDMLGYSGNEEKYQYIQKVLIVATRFNAIFLANDPALAGSISRWFPTTGLTIKDTDDAALGIAIQLVLFFENYGYGPTEPAMKLVESLYDGQMRLGQNAGIDYTIYKGYIMRAVSGLNTGGSKSWPSDLSATRGVDFGVLDADGNPVMGSLYEHLISLAPSEVKTFMDTNTGYIAYAASPSHYTRPRYALESYLMGLYDVMNFNKMLNS